jgi:hypothetical protein
MLSVHDQKAALQQNHINIISISIILWHEPTELGLNLPTHALGPWPTGRVAKEPYQLGLIIL